MLRMLHRRRVPRPHARMRARKKGVRRRSAARLHPNPALFKPKLPTKAKKRKKTAQVQVRSTRYEVRSLSSARFARRKMEERPLSPCRATAWQAKRTALLRCKALPKTGQTAAQAAGSKRGIVHLRAKRGEFCTSNIKPFSVGAVPAFAFWRAPGCGRAGGPGVAGGPAWRSGAFSAARVRCPPR